MNKYKRIGYKFNMTKVRPLFLLSHRGSALGKPRPIRLTESAIEPDYFWALFRKKMAAPMISMLTSSTIDGCEVVFLSNDFGIRKYWATLHGKIDTVLKRRHL